MPFSGTTYSEISSAADQVEDMIADNRQKLNRTNSQYSTIVSNMTALATEYGPIVAAVNALVASNPENRAFLFLQAHIEQLLADFNAVQADASAKDQLVNA